MSAKVLEWNDEKRWHETSVLLEHELSTRPHQVRRAFKSPDDLMNLSITGLGVLAAREHIQRRAVLRVVAKQKLFSCNELEKRSPSTVHM